MIKNKIFFSEAFFPKSRRASQVSFIISFALFISFLIFFISVIKPFGKVETGKESLLKHLEEKIIKDASEEILVVSALEDSTADCSEIDDLNIQNYISKQEGNLLKVYSSDEFQPNTFLCAAPPGYKIGLVRNQAYILKSKFLKLNESYNDDYPALKKSFGIPESNDFEFSFLDIGGNSIIETASKETPQTDVLSVLVPVNYLDEEDGAKIKNGYIKAVLW